MIENWVANTRLGETDLDDIIRNVKKRVQLWKSLHDENYSNTYCNFFNINGIKIQCMVQKPDCNQS